MDGKNATIGKTAIQ